MRVARWTIWVLLLAAAAEAEVVFDPPAWSPDKPLLRAAGVQTQVRLINRGKTTVELGAVRYQGPVFARTAAKSLAPGESAKVSVWVNAPDAYGPFTGTIEVPVAGQPVAKLRLSGTVGHASEVGLLPPEVSSGHYPARADGRRLVVSFFYQPGCEHCAMVLTEVAEPLARYFAAAVDLRIRPSTDMAAFVELQRLRDAYGLKAPAQTYAFVGGQALTDLGVDDKLYRLIVSELAHPTAAPALPPPSTVPAAELHRRLSQLGALAAIGLGAADGINPCAFATIVFLIALLTRLGQGRRVLAAAGLGYALAVFVTYTLLGLGVLRALAQVNQQLLLARLLRYAIAAWAAAIAVFQVRDVLRLRRGAPTRELSVQLPTSFKQRAHGLLRWATGSAEASQRFAWLWVGLATAAAGVLVTLIEMACTSQVYIPVLMLLRSEGWSRHAGRLLLAYNVGFVLPLVLVTGLALSGTGSERLAAWARAHLVACKLTAAALLGLLAALLLILH